MVRDETLLKAIKKGSCRIKVWREKSREGMNEKVVSHMKRGLCVNTEGRKEQKFKSQTVTALRVHVPRTSCNSKHIRNKIKPKNQE